MNYLEIYNKLCDRGKLVKKATGSDYYEKHHIKPVFMYKNNKRNTRYKVYQIYEGNPEIPENITFLTVREHFIAHVLLYMIYKHDKTFANPMAKSLMLFFKTVKTDQTHGRILNNNIKNSRLYEQMRQISSAEQSKVMKGKINVKDAITGEKIGLVSNKHENVINGTWVHHTKGRKNSESELQMRREMGKGSKNSNFKILTPELEQAIFKSLSDTSVIIDGKRYIHLASLMLDLNKTEYVISNYKKLSHAFIRRKYETTEKLIETYNSNKSITERIYYKQYGKLKGTKNVKN